jgi:nucleoside-triphosphatase THEP1
MDSRWATAETVAEDIDPALPLGVLVYDDSIAADRILSEAAAILGRADLRLAGVVQSNVAVPGRRKCAMNLVDLASGEEIAISQELGEGARGCRLDVAALAEASLAAERALRAGADLLIVNKFGKQEALGQGFRLAIAEALISGVPVVVGVSGLNLDALRDFVGAGFVALSAEPAAIAAWCERAVRRRGQPRPSA